MGAVSAVLQDDGKVLTLATGPYHATAQIVIVVIVRTTRWWSALSQAMAVVV